MAKRYQVTKTIQLGTPDEPDDFAFDEKIDLAVLLSQRLQRNVRQGHVFNIHKIEGNLKVLNDPLNEQEVDLGLAVQGEAYWCPATKNSARAWRHAFSVWRKQKALRANAIGPMVRYDDFEVGWNTGYTDPRTSTLFTTGIDDDTAEKVMIYGSSTDGDDVSLADIFDSAQPQPSPSRFPLSNSVVKESKFTYEFPQSRRANFGCYWSTVDSGVTPAPVGGDPGFDSGASYGSTPAFITDGASLCGVMSVRGRILPENTATHFQDDLLLDLTITVSIGTPLVRTRKAKRSRATKGVKGRKPKTGRKYARRKS